MSSSLSSVVRNDAPQSASASPSRRLSSSNPPVTLTERQHRRRLYPLHGHKGQSRELLFLCMIFVVCVTILTMEQLRHTTTVLQSSRQTFDIDSSSQDPNQSADYAALAYLDIAKQQPNPNSSRKHQQQERRHLHILPKKKQQQHNQVRGDERASKQSLRDQAFILSSAAHAHSTFFSNTTSAAAAAAALHLSLPTAPLKPLERMPTSFHDAVHMMMQLRHTREERATFVQIGANDGMTNDPIYKALVLAPRAKATAAAAKATALATTKATPSSNVAASTVDLRPYWMGLQAEPQPLLFQQLHQIGSPSDWYYYNGVVVAAAAVDATPDTTSNDSPSPPPPPPVCSVNGTIAFCETRTPGLGGWLTQGQINSLRMAKCEQKRHEKRFHIVHRPCVSSLESLVATAVSATASTQQQPQSLSHLFLDSLDLLQIDTEGHDLAILQMIFADDNSRAADTRSRFRPLCIHYEHWGAGEEAVHLLRSNGYTVNHFDTMRASDRLACRVDQKPLVAAS